MKKILLLGISLFSAYSFSQNIGIYVENTTVNIAGTEKEVVLDNAANWEGHLTLDVVNEGSTDLNVTITRVRMNHVAGTEDAVCWGPDPLTGTCYSKEDVSASDEWSTSIENLGSQETGWLALYYYANDNRGDATYRYYLIDENDNKLDSVDVRWDSKTVGTEEATLPEISVYPNPAKDVLKVKLDNTMDTYGFRIVDILGNVVYHNEKITSENIDISSLNSGVYFYSLLSKGEAVKTDRLVVKK